MQHSQPRLISPADADEMIEASIVRRHAAAENVGISRIDVDHPELGRLTLVHLSQVVVLLPPEPTAAQRAEGERLEKEAERRRKHRAELRRQEQAVACPTRAAE